MLCQPYTPNRRSRVDKGVPAKPGVLSSGQIGISIDVEYPDGSSRTFQSQSAAAIEFKVNKATISNARRVGRFRTTNQFDQPPTVTVYYVLENGQRKVCGVTEIGLLTGALQCFA